MSNETMKSELPGQLKASKVVAVAGAGVSIASSGKHDCASWEGLLKNGIERCERELELGEEWGDFQRRALKLKDLDAWLGVAEQAERKLQNAGGEFSKWLRETVGALPLRNSELIQAIRSLGAPIVTTNYDGLIEKSTGLRSIVRTEQSAEHALRGEREEGIVHLNGFWPYPESVVLGIRSYERILQDEHSQAMLKALSAFNTLLFIGCGEGLIDPNFGALLDWSRKVFEKSEFRHYRLAHKG